MENFKTKFCDDWMENAAGTPKSLFSVGIGCRVFHVPGINGLGQIIWFRSSPLPISMYYNWITHYQTSTCDYRVTMLVLKSFSYDVSCHL